MRQALVSVALVLLSCGGGDGDSDARRGGTDGGTGGSGGATPGSGGAAASGGTASVGGAAGGEPTRGFRLATTGAQLLVEGPELGLSLTAANVANDSDVIAIHQEFYGLPWDAFEAGAAPPSEWVRIMDRLASAAKSAGKPVFLSVSMLNGARETLAAKARIENGQVKTDDAWAPRCYDFASAPDAAAKRAAYLRYVDYMVAKFEPEYLNVAIEVNLFFEKCAAATPALIEVIDATYDAVKRARPATLVFPSFQIDHLNGYAKDSCPDPREREACFERGYAVLAPIKRDRFAMSSYPFLNEIGKAADVPPDWFTKGAARASEVPLIAETGWLSTGLVARARDGSCPQVFSFDEADSAAYLERVLADADELGLELVTWWSDRDLVVAPLMTDCPCDFDGSWCTVLDIFRGPAAGPADTQFFGEVLLKAFGAMGLRDYEGVERSGHFAAWNRARARAYVPGRTGP